MDSNEAMGRLYGLEHTRAVARKVLAQYDKPITDTAERVIPQSDTEMRIFGSGFGCYPWWEELTQKFERDPEGNAPNGWVWHVECLDDTEESTVSKEINHADLIKTIRFIADGGGDDVYGPSPKTRRECRRYLTDNGALYEDADGFDAVTVDEITQMAVLGKVVFA